MIGYFSLCYKCLSKKNERQVVIKDLLRQRQ
jgi:hypothetical protein